LTGSDTCFLWRAIGELSFDATYGTRIQEDQGSSMAVMWRPGFTARRVGSEVEVRDPSGTVVAVTGHRYRIDGGRMAATPSLPDPVFAACGRVSPVQ
jgi:hypothetical protein